MKKNYHIEEEIERTLQSLNGMKPATPKPFFYTRLQARMEKRIVTQKGWQWQPAYAFSVLALVLLLNVVTIYTITRSSTKNTQSIESFTSEYGLNNVGGIGLN